MDSLTALARRFGSDKGIVHGDAHGYSLLYEMFFRPLRDRAITLVELGLQAGGPEVPDIDADRAVSDVPSVRMWLDYFPRGRIVGFDISDFSAFTGDRFCFVRGDAGVAADLDRLAAEAGDIDIVIDDASHASFHQQLAFAVLFPKVTDGGLYIVEDLHWQPAHYESHLPPTPKTADVLRHYLRHRRFPDDGSDLSARLAACECMIGGIWPVPDPMSSDPAPKLAVIQKNVGDPEMLRAYHGHGLSRRIAEVGDFDSAVDSAQASLRACPHDFEVLHNTGVMLLLANRFGEAAPVLHSAVERNPASPDARLNLCVALHRLGRTDEAVDLARTAPSEARSVALTRLFAQLLLLTNDAAAAERETRAQLAGRPGDPLLRLYRAKALAALGRDGEALAMAEEAVAAAPDSADARVFFALLSLKSGHAGRAEAECRRAIEAAPALTEAHWLLGRALSELGRGEEALRAFQSALALRPDDEILLKAEAACRAALR